MKKSQQPNPATAIVQLVVIVLVCTWVVLTEPGPFTGGSVGVEGTSADQVVRDP